MISRRNKSTGMRVPARMNPSFHIEADGGLGSCSFVLSGVVGISVFSDSYVELLLKNGKLSLEGGSIKLSVYENKCVEVKGQIECLNIVYKGKRRALSYES